MIRRALKSALAATLHGNAASRRLTTWIAGGTRPVIVGYHSVVEDAREHGDDCMPAMQVGIPTLERHLDWLGRHYEFVTLDTAARRAANGAGKRGRPAATITFDDGYADVYRHAYPLLQRKGIPFAVFVVTDLLETGALQLHDELYLALARWFAGRRQPCRELQRLFAAAEPPLAAAADALERPVRTPFEAVRRLLTAMPQAELRRVVARLRDHVEMPGDVPECLQPVDWDMVTEMHRAGVTIGSHTRSHAVLINESADKIADEVRGSRRALERRCGGEIRHFAYPDGGFNPAVVEAVADAGYRYAYTACGCTAPLPRSLTLPRRLLWENSGTSALGSFSPAVFECEASGILDFASLCRRDHG